MTDVTEGGALALLANEEGYDPIEDRLRAMVRQTIETMFEEELADALGRGRYARVGKAKGYRNGTATANWWALSDAKRCASRVPGSRAQMVARANGDRRRCPGIVG